MPNLVQQIREAVLAAHPQAVVHERGPNHIKHRDGNLYIIDSHMGPIHYHDGADFQEINTDWVDSSESGFTDSVTAAPFHVHSDGNGGRRIYPRRDVLTEYVEFSRPQYWTGTQWSNLVVGTRVRTADSLKWDRPNFSLEIIHGGSQLKVLVVLKNTNAAKRIRWPVTLTGLTWNAWTLVADSDSVPVLEVWKPTLIDANDVHGTITGDYVGGAVEFSADLTGLTFPITIDPTIDVQVAANTNNDSIQVTIDDAGVPSNDDFFLTGTPGGSGYYRYVGHRWTGITIPAGATIGSNTYYQPDIKTSGSLNITAYGQESQTPATFGTGTNDISGRTRTTASVNWTTASSGTGFQSSPSVQSIIAELLASYTYSSAALVFTYEAQSNGSCVWYGYTQGSAYAAKLHIEYTTEVLDQEGFRWRNDDEDENSATWVGDQDAQMTAPTGENRRIRMLINTTNDAAAKQFQLEWRLSAGTWRKVK